MESEILQRLRNCFLSRRENLKLTYRAIAVQTGVSETTLCRFAAGKGNLDTDTLLAIGGWLNVPAAEIFGQKDINRTPAASSLDEVRRLILADDAIPEERRQDLCAWFENTYETFKKK